MSICSNCEKEYESTLSTCPYCRASVFGGRVVKADASQDLDGIKRTTGATLLARTADVLGAELTRDIGGPLSVAALGGALSRMEAEQAPSLASLERFLDDSSSAVRLEGIALGELLGEGKDTKIVRRGLAFLRKGRYVEAVEWWRLNRQSLSTNKEKMSLLLLLLECFTHQLVGDKRARAQTLEKVRSHPALPRGLKRGHQ